MARKNFHKGANAVMETEEDVAFTDRMASGGLPVDVVSEGDPVFTGDPDAVLEKGLDDEPVERTVLDNVKLEGVYFVGPASVDEIIALGFSVQQDDPKSLTVFVGDEEVLLKLGEGITADGEKLESL